MERVEIAGLGRIAQPPVGLGTPACRVEPLRQSPHCKEITGLGGRAQQRLEIVKAATGLLDLRDREPQGKVFASVTSPLPPNLSLLSPASLAEPPGQGPHGGRNLASLDVPAQPLLSLTGSAGVIEPLGQTQSDEMGEGAVRLRGLTQPHFGFFSPASPVEPVGQLLHDNGIASLCGSAQPFLRLLASTGLVEARGEAFHDHCVAGTGGLDQQLLGFLAMAGRSSCPAMDNMAEVSPLAAARSIVSA